MLDGLLAPSGTGGGSMKRKVVEAISQGPQDKKKKRKRGPSASVNTLAAEEEGPLGGLGAFLKSL